MHNINKYYGDNKPIFEPYVKKLTPSVFDLKLKRDNVGFVICNAISPLVCNELIAQFDEQEKYAVGVDGFVDPNTAPGSYRTMGWAVDLAALITKRLEDYTEIPFEFRRKGFTTLYNVRNTVKLETPFLPSYEYTLLGSTPWLRFMKYMSGGKHTPHYDAPYHNEKERYITFYSWVLYLNTPKGKGGEFQFVDDHQEHLHPKDCNRSDWTEMSDDIIHSIAPEQGKLLIFPHWLCHQVQEYVGEGARYICRGDVAYGYDYEY